MSGKTKISIVIVVAIFLNGCADKHKSYSAIVPENEVKTFDLKDCERELQALREVDNEKLRCLKNNLKI